MNVLTNRTPRYPTGRVAGLMASASQAASQLATNSASALRRRPKGQNASAQRRNEAQGATATVQQDVPPTTASTRAVSTPDRTIANTDMSQEHGESSADASFLSEVSRRAPQFAHGTGSHRSPTIAGPIPELATTNNADLLGMLIPTPSPRRTTQSPETLSNRCDRTQVSRFTRVESQAMITMTPVGLML